MANMMGMGMMPGMANMMPNMMNMNGMMGMNPNMMNGNMMGMNNNNFNNTTQSGGWNNDRPHAFRGRGQVAPEELSIHLDRITCIKLQHRNSMSRPNSPRV